MDLGLKSHPNDWWSGGIEQATPLLVVQYVILYTTEPLPSQLLKPYKYYGPVFDVLIRFANYCF